MTPTPGYFRLCCHTCTVSNNSTRPPCHLLRSAGGYRQSRECRHDTCSKDWAGATRLPRRGRSDIKRYIEEAYTTSQPRHLCHRGEALDARPRTATSQLLLAALFLRCCWPPDSWMSLVRHPGSFEACCCLSVGSCAARSTRQVGRGSWQLRGCLEFLAGWPLTCLCISRSLVRSGICNDHLTAVVTVIIQPNLANAARRTSLCLTCRWAVWMQDWREVMDKFSSVDLAEDERASIDNGGSQRSLRHSDTFANGDSMPQPQSSRSLGRHSTSGESRSIAVLKAFRLSDCPYFRGWQRVCWRHEASCGGQSCQALPTTHRYPSVLNVPSAGVIMGVAAGEEDNVALMEDVPCEKQVWH